MIIFIKTFYSLLIMNIKIIRRRIGLSLVAVLSVAVVVGVFLAILSMAGGFVKVYNSAGSDNTLIIMASGAKSEINSYLPRDQVDIIFDAIKMIKMDQVAVISPEVFLVVDAPDKGTGKAMNLPIRGVLSEKIIAQKAITISSGRMFQWGQQEIIIGNSAAKKYQGFELGQKIKLGNKTWTVVGTFSAGGSVIESEVWGDANVLQSMFNRPAVFQSARLFDVSEEQYKALKKELSNDPRVDVILQTEKAYYMEQSEGVVGFIRGLGYPIVFIMAIGAFVGSFNTMFASISARQKEIATLRVIGFGGSSILLATLFESLILAIIGAVIGIAVTYLMFNGFTASTLSDQSFSQVVFDFTITQEMAKQAMIVGCVIGLFGGVYPAIKATKIPLNVALGNG